MNERGQRLSSVDGEDDDDGDGERADDADYRRRKRLRSKSCSSGSQLVAAVADYTRLHLSRLWLLLLLPFRERVSFSHKYTKRTTTTAARSFDAAAAV